MPEVVERRYRSRDDDQQALVVLGKTWPATQVRCPTCQGLVRLDAEQCLVCKTELNVITQLRSAVEQMQARIRQSEAREAEARDRLLRHETKWEVIRLANGDYHCSWVNPETQRMEQRIMPKDFNPHILDGIEYDDTKENCTVTYSGGKPMEMPTSLLRALRAEIQPPTKKKIPIEDLEAILRRRRFSGPVRLEMKKAWGYLIRGKETVPQIAEASGVSKEAVYRYRDVWLDRGLVLINGEQVRPHPGIFELTETVD